MSAEQVMEIMKEAMLVAFEIAGPLLIISIAVGLLVAIFQAATQIHEQTLTFVPKLIVIALVLFVYVAADVFVAQYDVLVAAFAVGRPERYDAGAVIGDLHGDVACMERVECDWFAVDGGLECLFGQQREFRFLHAARSQQRHAE